MTTLTTLILLFALDAATLELELYRCFDITSVANKVTCYDNLVVDLKTPPEAARRANFGLNEATTRREVKLDQLQDTVTEANLTPRGKWTLKLANGQTWVQVDGARLTLAAGTEVTIESGFGNAYYLKKTEGSRRLKVRRIE
jgi:hypothetical protein